MIFLFEEFPVWFAILFHHVCFSIICLYHFLNGILIAVAARGGMETLRPTLQRIYMTRASAYRDALKNFIEGYQEEIQRVMEKKDDGKPEDTIHQVMKKEDSKPEDAYAVNKST